MGLKHLDLFSGTHSVSNVFKQFEYESTTLDLLLDADIQEDILKWDYKVYPQGHFDVITASPVCAFWSVLKKSNIGRGTVTKESIKNDIENIGKPMVDKVFEIIDYFKPKFWWIENPKSGSMKSYISETIPYYDVDYCMYGTLYRKSTRIWTNIKNFKPMVCDKKCSGYLENYKRHRIQIGHCAFIKGDKQPDKMELYKLPEHLVKDLISSFHMK